ncbi:CBS domain-containing protein [Teredinibacter franksiae]|uniref:CBS domain-containing protein n=1 Tax=Teredinibacter franksiae TaxID=2761453 RepID=UPI00162376CC|nr:CBS domain-containing protein [Teredinibacter franksiae]
MNVADIMSRQVHTISPNETLAELRNIFSEVSYRHLLVEDEGKLVGIISDRDALAYLSPFLGTETESESDRSLLNLEVCEFMSRDPITVDTETTIDTASILLLENAISCLPVINDEMSIEGILSWKDILQFHIYGIDNTLED